MLSPKRRELLRAAGAGAILSVFAKRWTKPAAAAPEKKFLMVWHANGAPTVGETGWAEKVPGMDLKFHRYGGPGDHKSGIPYSVTGFSDGIENSAQGPSIDHVIAKAQGKPLMTVTGQAKHQNYRGWSSFDDSGSPILSIESPRAAFTSIFGIDPGGGDPALPTTGDPAVPSKSYSQDLEKAVLDRVLTDIADIRQNLDGLQRSKMDDQFEATQMLSERVAAVANPTNMNTAPLPSVDADCSDLMTLSESFREPAGGLDYVQRTDLHIELIALALACGVRTTATWVLSPAGHDSMEFSFAGIPGEDPHDTIAHDKDKADLMRKIKNWEMDRVARLMHRLEEIPDADGGALLDSTAVLITTEVSWGSHQPVDSIPVMVGGTASGAHAGNYTQTLVNVARAAGANIGSFGDGN